MRFNTSDLKMVELFCARLREACIEMEDGTPMSRALSDCDIGRSTFYTLIKGLRKSKNGMDADFLDTLRHPSWQDELASDICENADYYLPDDFEQSLDDIMQKYLSPDETAIINSCYKSGRTLSECAELLDCDESEVRFKKTKALKKLRVHREELIVGSEYLKHYDELKALYDKRKKELNWMSSAVRYLNDTEAELSSDELPYDEKRFFKAHGFNRLSDVMDVRPQSLAEALASDKNRFDTGRTLEELGFDKNAVNAFHQMSIDSADDILELSADEIMSLPAERIRDVIRLYRMILEDGGLL